MHQTARAEALIDQINRAAIGNVNAEANAALICDQAIAILEAFVLGNCAVDNSDAVSVNLLRGNKRSGAERMLSANFSMNDIQARERFRLVVRHLNARHAQGETVNDLGQRAQRRELFSRKLIPVHLPEVVVRVVRAVVLV
jgi:hypothetical protein